MPKSYPSRREKYLGRSMKHPPGRALATGRRVLLRSPTAADEDKFLAAVRASKKLHRPWSAPPWTHQKFVAMLRRNESDEYDALLVVTREEGAIAGCANLQ